MLKFDRQIIFILILIIALLCAYFQFTYVNFSRPDDSWMLLNNPWVRKSYTSLMDFEELFYTSYYGQYSPINTIYYNKIFKLLGYDPFSFHIGSIIIHFVNTLLLYRCLIKCFEIFMVGNNGYFLIAQISALLWMVHPLNVEAVIWISASKIPLYTMFFFFSFLFFLKYFQTKKYLELLLSFLFYFTSCLCKEQASLIPFIFIVFYGCFLFMKQSRQIDYKMMFYLILSILVSFLFINITMALNSNDSSDFKPILGYSIQERAYLSIYCLNFYLKNTILPFDLHFNYRYTYKAGEAIPILILVFPFLFSSVIILYFKKIINYFRHNPVFLFFVLAFLSQIAIALQIIPLGRNAIVADRYMYLPLIFLIPICILSLFKLENKAICSTIVFIYSIYFIFVDNQIINQWILLNVK